MRDISHAAMLLVALFLLAVGQLGVNASGPTRSLNCRRGTCFSADSTAAALETESAASRKLQQFAGGWGSGFSTCAGKPLVIAHGKNVPKKIDDFVYDLESPLTMTQVAKAANFNFVVDPNKVELIDLSDPNSCIRNINTIQGALVVYDDGSISQQDLAALSNIKTIMGTFYLYGTAGQSQITSLKGLENLQVVGGLNVAKMDKLQNLDALAQLTQIQGDLVVWSNAELRSIEGLGPVTTLFGKLWVDANPKLTTLRGLESLQSVSGDVILRNSDGMTSLDGLNSLQVVQGELGITSLPIATSKQLGNLTTVGISLSLNDLPNLEDLTGFSRLAQVPGDLQLYMLPKITSVNELANLQAVGLNLVIGANANLVSLAGLGNLRSVGLLLSISFNPKLATLKGLGNLRYIGQDLVVRGNAGLTTLDDLTKSLASVGAFRGADVFIEDNPKLTSLAGLGSGKAAIYGDVFVQGNPGVPQAEIAAVKDKAIPVPITVEVLQYGLPKNVSQAAAVSAANATAQPAAVAPVGAANATAQPAAVAPVEPAAGAANATAQPAAVAPVEPAAGAANATAQPAAVAPVQPAAAAPAAAVPAATGALPGAAAAPGNPAGPAAAAAGGPAANPAVVQRQTVG